MDKWEHVRRIDFTFKEGNYHYRKKMNNFLADSNMMNSILAWRWKCMDVEHWDVCLLSVVLFIFFL